MKKSDLARRAVNFAHKIAVSDDTLPIFTARIKGFEAGYRAARADLRQQLKWAALKGIRNLYTPVLAWLRPIR